MALLQVATDLILGNITATLIFLIVFCVLWKYLQPSSYVLPPGPRPWPVVGHLHMFSPFGEVGPHERIWDLAKQYKSKTIGLYLGPYYAMMLHDYDDVKKMFAMDEFSGRGNVPFWKIFLGGLVGSDGPRWKEQRRFSLSTLRDFGLGKNKLEKIIHAEAEHLFEVFDSYKGKPKDISIVINNVVSNIICSLIFGHRFDYDDPTFVHMLELMEENFNKNLFPVSIGSMTPGLKYLDKILPGDIFKFRRTVEVMNEMRTTVIKTEYESHKAKYDPNIIEDYIDAFYKEVKAREGKEQTEEHWFTEKQLNMNIEDLFQVGTETTTTSLKWIILYMMHFPEIQEKVRAEIHNVIGHDRLPSMRDKTDLPFTEAVFTEVQRKQVILPLSIGNCTFDKPTEFEGYVLPPYTRIYANIHAIHHDPEYWKEPDKFIPERFLDKDGKYCADERMLTFSTGKRACLGEGLARMELFIFATAILQKYRLVKSEKAPLPPLRFLKGSSTFIPQPYEVCLIRV
ncbi:unnamed protein product [Owenia fusiformis]|uniref:Uncharacterized protein n=1 Tax=Owenia fusiformis TaxID=6347 RepID=A0A8J1UE03_OWEFU|nr:unnamed protein product [Owenia fusiformis]